MRKMKTPIIDFINDYKGKKPLRLHTPGHKGFVFCGHEEDDITEIPGADELFSPDGIIELSQKNVSRLFGVPTYYSTEGSSLCVRAMVFLLCNTYIIIFLQNKYLNCTFQDIKSIQNIYNFDYKINLKHCELCKYYIYS